MLHRDKPRHFAPAAAPTGTGPAERPVVGGGAVHLDRGDVVYQAWMLLRVFFTAAPILFGLDKFFGVLVDWDRYLSPAFASLSPMSVHTTMYVVGVIEIVAGLIVAFHPRLGAYIVAAWLGVIIVNLVLVPGFFDVALRDLGLLVAALALQRLSTRMESRPTTWPLTRH